MKKFPVILACFFAACAAPEQAANNVTAPKEAAAPAATSEPSVPVIGPIVGIANPASVYCTQIGGKLDMVNNTGICTLPNGEKIEEWALYRRDHH